MKILILTSAHPYKKAGIVALDLYNGLKEIKGNEVKIIVREWDKYTDKNIIPIDTSLHEFWRRIWDIRRRIIKKLLKVLFGYKINEEPKVKTNPDYCVQGVDQTITFFQTKKILKRAGFRPEIVIVLFMSSFISFKNLNEIFKLTGAPIFLYLMDMAPFTGGCHYAWDCNGYTDKCGYCPALYSENQNDQSRVNYLYKKKYIESTNIIPVSGTEWQNIQLGKSSLFKNKRKLKALLPINENQYFPYNKIEKRHELGFPFDKKIVFFGAFSVDEKRKGFNYLIEALNILSKTVEDSSMIHLVIAGNNNQNLKYIFPFSYTFLGYLDHNILPAVFQSADIFVSPSIEDSGPMMVNQSIMCGTPVVTFEMGVALDLVQNGETGYRAKLKDSNDFAIGIKYILDLNDLEYRDMSTKCRETGLSLYQSNNIAKEWMEIFKNYS